MLPEAARPLCCATPRPGREPWIPGLAATWSRNVTLLAVDRPGYGGSDPMRAGAWATVVSAAEDLRHVLAERGETQVGLVGWGEGGWSALALAAQVPGLVHRLVLIGTPAPDESLPYLSLGTRELIARSRAAFRRRRHGPGSRRMSPPGPPPALPPTRLWSACKPDPGMTRCCACQEHDSGSRTC